MAVLCVVSLFMGSTAAALADGARPPSADRLQWLGGSLVAIGLILLGAGLQSTTG